MDTSTHMTGNLTKDPELRFTSTGIAVTNFGLAVNNRYQVNGEWKTETSFFNVLAWKDLGEQVASNLRKGDHITVVGRLQARIYETEAGDRRSVTELVATDVAASVRFANVAITKKARDMNAAPGVEVPA